MERYESLGVVGEGSYGVVLKCRHRDTGQVVAVKKFLESDEDPNVKKIALREVRMLKKVRHENLVNLIEFFRRKRRLYLVFEYVDHTVLEELEATESGLDPAVARSHIFQVIRGVAYCHKNQIVHRDVKPENVLVSRLGIVKLCDFGFARMLEGGPNESCTDYVATRWYRAPELLVGDTKYGREVDVWAIGCLLAEVLCGDPLFPGESDIDQLFHIIQTLGELTASHQSLVAKNPIFSGLHLPSAASTPLLTSFPKWSPKTLNFISQCLDLTPRNRPTAEELLIHDYFTYDSFPDTFLPELRKKVQEEFSSNLLIQPLNTRKGSGQSEKKCKKGKNSSLDNFNKFGAKTLQQFTTRLTSTQKTSTTATTNLPISSSSVYQEPFTNPPLIPPHAYSVNQLYNQSQTQSSNQSNNNLQSQAQSYSQSSNLHSNIQSHSQSSSQPQSQNTQTTQRNTSPKSVITYTTLTSTNFGNRSSTSHAFPFDEGPVSLPFSHIPPLKEMGPITGQNNNSSVGNSHISSIFGPSFQPKNSVGTGALNLQLMLSPTRKLRKEEKNRKSPQHFWAATSNPKSQNLLIKGQNQPPNQTTPNSSADSLTLMPSTRDNNVGLHNSDTTVTSFSPFSRHNQFDFARHPYAISLDRTKESSGRESSRDPLREIRENSKESKPDNLAPREGKESQRKSRKEVSGWTKPKLLNDDLYLPNLLAVPGKSNSSQKLLRTETGTEERGSKREQNRAKKSDHSMPFLGGLERGSASSVDSTDTTARPNSNLPFF